ncbi:hypothetical protein EAI89_09230 [Eubacterium sp. am_0171]|nr:hypothetical protein EAI89_09230 [Eubacterium sp. am_0171]
MHLFMITGRPWNIFQENHMSHSGTQSSDILKEEGTAGSYYLPCCTSPAVRHEAFGMKEAGSGCYLSESAGKGVSHGNW